MILRELVSRLAEISRGEIDAASDRAMEAAAEAQTAIEQLALKAKGYYEGRIDGVKGKVTEAAAKAYADAKGVSLADYLEGLYEEVGERKEQSE